MGRMTEELERAKAFFHFWKKADWQRNAEEIGKYLAQTSDAGRVECREGLDDKGLRKLWLTVTDIENGQRVQLNEGWDISWPCPPGPGC